MLVGHPSSALLPEDKLSVSEAGRAVWHVGVCLLGLFLPCVRVLEQPHSLTGGTLSNEKAVVLFTHWW